MAVFILGSMWKLVLDVLEGGEPSHFHPGLFGKRSSHEHLVGLPR